MTNITISLSDENARKLEEQAKLNGVDVSTHLRRILEICADAPLDQVVGAESDRYRRAKEYVFKKNAELYRRLA